ncbi:MAG: hypothetical protein M1820_001573 [Bogoriella megaspora]|nr:MAG: hypothetical protein M1820_001573 [Bogoriella megaspora]
MRPVPSNIQNQKNSSGESSNADNWFENSNNHISQGSNVMDNDPPFFLRNSSSSESPPDNMRHDSGPPASGLGNFLIQRSGLVRGNSQGGGSSSEDFRSVIDDLTVENKKLKRRLKKYEKLHDAHLQDEKLFEVRIHGLASEKKRELEETLKMFVSNLDGSPASGSSLIGPDRYAPALATHKTASSTNTSNNLPADSAYASMSASGQGSSAPGHTSTGASGHERAKGMAKSAKSRQENIHSYLHDIPEGLLPRRPLAMTERAKSKLVVRRLEQIFAGKGAAVEGHQQPLQQQEVSQMAAKADRNAIEARGQQPHPEGLREARIMPEETEDPANIRPNKGQILKDDEPKSRTSPVKLQQEQSGTSSPDQRPTRPLDLDPYRAQVPLENINYIRHLGFSPPDVQLSIEQADGHGWIYLNLLINMAQLHTLNVTSDFVKKAITDYSSKFELSSDGRKVRWQGGPGVTRTSSDGSSPGEVEQAAAHRSNNEGRSNKKPKSRKTDRLVNVPNGSESQQRSINGTSSNNQFSYTPLFYRQQGSEEDLESSYEDSGLEESPQPAYVTGNSSGLASSGMRTSSSRKKKEDGPIIFYNKARFCTDLSGDRRATSGWHYSQIDYESITPNVIGSDAGVKPRVTSGQSSKGPLSKAANLPEPMDLDDNPIPIEQELSFPNNPSPQSESGSQSSSLPPVEFEVSGLGGVCPDDNFEITVKSRHAPMADHSRNAKAAHGFARRVPPHRLAGILGQHARPVSPATAEQIIATKQKKLPPSALPPPSYFHPEASPDTDESDADSDASQDPDTSDHEVPAAAPQPMTIPIASSDEESSEESEDEEDEGSDSDASLDLLATAREADPATIQAQEREYDSNMAERLAEEIPTGSSAATAGGGSGFNSPASAMVEMSVDSSSDDDSERGNKVRKPKPRKSFERESRGPAGLKRTRTSESMVVHGKTPKLD